MKTGFLILIAFLILSGCGGLLPSAKQTVRSPWASFDEAKAAYDKIIPRVTTNKEMQELGFDPFATPNIKILTYLDVMNRFLPNTSIKKEDLDTGILGCIEAKALCKAYEFSPQFLKSKRYGNVLFDLLNFSRKTRESGWRFDALIVVIDDIVVYKLWGGTPNIDQTKEEKKPLGPLQSAEDLLKDAVKPPSFW